MTLAEQDIEITDESFNPDYLVENQSHFQA